MKSKIDGFRSRSSYKLIQIDNKFNFLNSRKSILDLGCSPGGWLQVARKFSSIECKILGIDLIELQKLPNISFIKKDVFDTDTIDKIKEFFENKKIDLLMSDMSPNSSGNKKLDHLRIVSLVEKVLEISSQILEKDGILISKIFQGGAQGELINQMKKTLNSVKYFKPKASRIESSEIYLVAKKK
tara:strand:+ start:51 stop:605 length:555 start_codon:yes stop_codon:yes gene_type:complete